MSNLPTVDAFRIERQTSLSGSRTTEAKRANIIALAARGFTPSEVAEKTYGSQIPSEDARTKSPEGHDTLDSRMLARYRKYVEYVQQTIEQEV